MNALPDDLVDTGTKRCTGCNTLKPLDDFPSDKSKVDGKHTRCRVCKRRTDSSRKQNTRTERALRSEANRRALVRLIERHRQEFAQLVRSERAALGEPPPKPKWMSLAPSD